MSKRVFIIHGWGGLTSHGWYPWIKKELDAKGYDAYLPQMPNTDAPNMKKWMSFITKTVGKADEDTYFVGHSIGCQTIVRYLESIDGKVGGAVFVAGWLPPVMVTGLTDEEKPIAMPWVNTPIDYEKIGKTTKKFTAIFSDNDPYVPLENAKFFREKLGAKIIIEKGKGHYTEDEDNCMELPIALNELLKIMKRG
jgi:predicted alpha/beta hydrolase family esterase